LRVAVTGANGFVGRWFIAELRSAGHESVELEPGRDIRDAGELRAWLRSVRPDAIAHLAAVSFGPDARARPAEAFEINVGGTIALMEAIRELEPSPVVLVTGSSEVYGIPNADDLPLRESQPLAPTNPYGLSKAAQEAVAIAYASRLGMRVVVTRAFNHIGPGQRPDFVVPALTDRLLAVRSGTTDRVRVGNLHVRRDLTDVRDVVVAYRVLLEGLAAGTIASGGVIFNVASGRSVAIDHVLDRLAQLIGVSPTIEVDPELVRASDAPEIVGDPSAIEDAVGWQPRIPLDQTLSDIVESALSATRS
jgi:GDP-4-dehydro-6-deoxy-D-mannose reductase